MRKAVILILFGMINFIILMAAKSVLPKVAIDTEIGRIVIEVDTVRAPVTAGNFLRYVDEGRFEGASFYRVVTMDNQPSSPVKIEVIQGGIQFAKNNLGLPPIRHETTKETGILHRDGVISMARARPGTASSEFFICVNDQPELDFGGRRNPDGQGFAAFGRVIEGMDVVRAIQRLPARRQYLNPRLAIRKVSRLKQPNSDIQQSKERLEVSPDRIKGRIEALAAIGGTGDGGVNRVAFSKDDIQARAFIMKEMKGAGLKVRVDAAGNIFGRLEGKEANLPPLMSGSHLDTVPHGGRFDGTVGVISALECAQVFSQSGMRLQHPFVVAVFTDEEGGLIGSRAMNGTLTPKALDVVSHSGKTVREGIQALGGDPEVLGSAIWKQGDIDAFIEVHIEQGAVLENKKIDIGVVEGIVGINWWDVTVKGMSNHAGTTPMNMRHDALIAASRFVLAVNRIITSEPGRQVGTVGRIHAEPGAPNVIPGRVLMSLEIRDLSADKIKSLFEKIKEEATAIGEEMGIRFSFASIDATAVPVPTDPDIRQAIAAVAKELDLSFLIMPSGAGHDAQDIARIAPTDMIFVPSQGGISHSPREFTKLADIVNGATVLLRTLIKLDKQ